MQHWSGTHVGCGNGPYSKSTPLSICLSLWPELPPKEHIAGPDWVKPTDISAGHELGKEEPLGIRRLGLVDLHWRIVLGCAEGKWPLLWSHTTLYELPIRAKKKKKEHEGSGWA